MEMNYLPHFTVPEPLDYGSAIQPSKTAVCHELIEPTQVRAVATRVHETGLIIHIITHTSTDGILNMSVYDLHQSGRNMLKQYKKFNKGVVIIHHLTPGEDIKLADLVVNLILSDPNIFSGQTMIL
uniref:Uncharacterized protein n=1 Tax=Timema cristinae TaxID=61476 RepID=A0A7R9DE80_TIMCR|nr:unnamed protein product [Timema cristinae]